MMDFLTAKALLLGAIASVVIIATGLFAVFKGVRHYVVSWLWRAWGAVVRIAAPFLPRVGPPRVLQLSGKAFVEQTQRSLEEARLRQGPTPFVGQLDMYCENSACAVREVGISVKEFDKPTPPHLICPACGHVLEPYRVRSQIEPSARGSAVAAAPRQESTDDGPRSYPLTLRERADRLASETAEAMAKYDSMMARERHDHVGIRYGIKWVPLGSGNPLLPTPY
jgi:hypothetical protein